MYAHVLSRFHRVWLSATLWTVAHQASPWDSPGKNAAAAAKSLRLCLTLCGPIDSSPPGSPIPGILQARTLEWVAISFSNAWKWKVKVKSLSRVQLLVTPWTAAYQAPPSMGFSRQESWSGLPMPSSRESSWPRDQTHISFCFLRWWVGGFFTLAPPGKPHNWLWFPFPDGSDGTVSAYNAGDTGSVPGLGRSSGEGNHSSTLAWKMGSMGSQRVGHD